MKGNLLLLYFIGILTIGCGSHKGNDGKIGEEAITLKIVQINDVYEIAPLNGGKYGGLARVAHVRDSIKNIFPNTYLFLAGDFLNPSLLGTIKVNGERIYGRQMIEVLNAMDIDLVTFGNHEFDLSEADLQKRLNESQFEWTSANVREVKDNDTLPFAKFLGNSVIPVSDFASLQARDKKGNDIKFGVVSVTLPSNPQEYVFYGDIYKEAVRAFKLANQKHDFVLGLTHLTIEEDREMAKQLPEIPLIMGGHEHNAMLEQIGNTTIAKADANAKSVYVHTLIYNPNTKALKLTSQLVFIDGNTPSSPFVEKVVSNWTNILDEKLKEVITDPNQVIYVPPIPLDGTDSASRSIQTNLGAIITKAIAFSYENNVDAALVNGGSIRIDDMLEGEITSKDIFRVLPFGGSILKVELTGKLLKEVLDYGKAKRGTGAYLQRYNIQQSPTGDWLVQNGPIIEEKIYTVAFSDFLLKGLDIPFLTPENKGVVRVYTPAEKEISADIRKAIIFYLNSQKKD